MQSGIVTAKDVDGRAVEFLAQLPGPVGATAIEELGRANLSGVRNVSAYFKTICRRAAESAGLSLGAAQGGMGPGGMGPRGVRDDFQGEFRKRYPSREKLLPISKYSP